MGAIIAFGTSCFVHVVVVIATLQASTVRATYYRLEVSAANNIALVVQIASLLALLFQLRHRALYSNEMTADQRAALGEADQRAENEKGRGVCSFWVLPARYIRDGWDSREGGETTLPRFQELKKRNWLERKEISQADAFGQATLVGKWLAISHRWMNPEEPDKGGEQMSAIKAHLIKPENAGIEWVGSSIASGTRIHIMPAFAKRGPADQTVCALGCSQLLVNATA